MAPTNIPGPTNAPAIVIPSIVFFVVTPLIVFLRLWCRLKNRGGLGADDYTIIVAMIFSVASGAVELASVNWGYGHHSANLTTTEKVNALKYFYICQVTYKSCINLTKASIVLLYMRIFGNVRWFRYSCIALLTVVAMYCVASVVATIFQCTPIERAYNKAVAGTCINSAKFWYANGGYSIATDLIVLILPLPLVYRLQIPAVQKIALMCVFLIGSFVLVTSCLRLTTVNMEATAPDTTWEVTSTLWTIVEMNVAVICASLPQLRPLIVKLFPKFMAATSSRSRTTGAAHTTAGFGKSVLSTPGNEESHWARVDAREAIHMTNIRKADTSSEEYILQEDGPMQIHKTVEYNVSYTKD